MDLAEGLPAISAAAVTSKRRSWPRAALAFREARQWARVGDNYCAGKGHVAPELLVYYQKRHVTTVTPFLALPLRLRKI